MSCGHMRLRQVLRHIGQAETGQRGIEYLSSAVEDELAFNAHPQFAAAFFELPRVQPTHQHIHTVVRTPNGNDYGKDLLRQHYLRRHGR
jgi:hypothetical protein